MGMDCIAYYLMGMVAAHFEILHSHLQRIGISLNEKGHANMEEVQSTQLSIKLCIKEHQQLLEYTNVILINDVHLFDEFIRRLVRDIEENFSIQFASQIFLSGAFLSGATYQLTIVRKAKLSESVKVKINTTFVDITVREFLSVHLLASIHVDNDNPNISVHLFWKWGRDHKRFSHECSLFVLLVCYANAHNITQIFDYHYGTSKETMCNHSWKIIFTEFGSFYRCK